MLPDYRVRQREYLLEISRALTEELDLNTLLGRILQISIEMLSGHSGFIALAEENRGWHLAVSKGIPTALSDYLENWLGSLPEDLTEDSQYIPEINKMLSDISMGMITGVGLPLLVQQKSLGQIFVFRNYRGIFTANDHSILNNFANQAAIAVRNARLYNQVRDQNLRMAALLASVADGIVILSPDLRIQSTNKAFARLINTPSVSLEGEMYEDVVKWQSEPIGLKIKDLTQSGWQDYEPGEMFLEGDLIRNGGLEPIPVAITYAPLFSKTGQLLNVIASVRDITRYREAEEMKTGFISAISHELRTPLALIKGYASTLRRKDVKWDADMVQESLKVIEEEADHLAAMVDDLLDATKLQSGDVILKKSQVDILSLVQAQIKRFKPESINHEIRVEIDDDFPVIVVDEERIKQLFTNLFANALKYSTGGQILIKGQNFGHEIMVCVSDQGKGFDPKDIPFVFDRFYRSDKDAKSTKGTGLGLYLCKSIVLAHGGRIWIDENYKEGARVCFTLPVG
ncbi:MAG TPA: hypothetical protein DD636_05555 [Anaerolineaceae bacterium]|jgi:K+-sensing histidine kinase KdpD|nr:hypothetical protein [Anaerolineaceae bacterium]